MRESLHAGARPQAMLEKVVAAKANRRTRGAGAEGEPDARFTVAAGRADQHEIAHVEADDQQDGSDRAEQQPERGARSAGNLLEQWEQRDLRRQMILPDEVGKQ